jgi:hypothetical protein
MRIKKDKNALVGNHLEIYKNRCGKKEAENTRKLK